MFFFIFFSQSIAVLWTVCSCFFFRLGLASVCLVIGALKNISLFLVIWLVRRYYSHISAMNLVKTRNIRLARYPVLVLGRIPSISQVDVMSKMVNLNRSRHLFTSTEASNLKLFKKNDFSHTSA